VDKFSSPDPEKDGGDGHQDSRNSKGPVWAMPFQDERDREIGNDGSEVNREIEDIKNAWEQMLIF